MRNLRSRRLHTLRGRRGRGKRSFSVVVIAVVSVVACFALTTGSALASGDVYQCVDSNGTHASDPVQKGYWYAQVQTGSPGYAYSTLGAKANLTTDGNPYESDPVNQHALVHLTALEQTGPNVHGKWVQVGWDDGEFGTCSSEISLTSPQIYVEIYDDTSAPCLAQTYGAAPENASYDARYYGQVSWTCGNPTCYEYRVFYQAPGSSTIQYLAYGDFTQQYTAEIAGGEVLGDKFPNQSPAPTCPWLSQPGYPYSQIGYPQSSTFASIVQLWNGSGWYDWTSGTQTGTVIEAPYQLNVQSSYKQLTVGGQ
jgi:hypothetical protein